MLFKILIIQAQNTLSDDRTEFLINDRLSFMRVLGLGLTDRCSGKARLREDGTRHADIAIPVFGSKSHASIDRRHGFIRK